MKIRKYTTYRPSDKEKGTPPRVLVAVSDGRGLEGRRVDSSENLQKEKGTRLVGNNILPNKKWWYFHHRFLAVF